jgi:hypothetical protein
MTMKKTLLAAALAFALPAVPAFAHEDDYYDSYQHERDHYDHYRYHDRLADEHARAHEEGFWSPGEHRAYHRYLRWKHREFHEDHPGTWHDHWWWRQRYYGNW